MCVASIYNSSAIRLPLTDGQRKARSLYPGRNSVSVHHGLQLRSELLIRFHEGEWLPLFRRIFLARCFDTRQDPYAQEHDGAHHDPVGGDMHQTSAVNQSANHEHESNGV